MTTEAQTPETAPQMSTDRPTTIPKGQDSQAPSDRWERAAATRKATMDRKRALRATETPPTRRDTGYRPGDRIHTNCPKSTRFHDRDGTVITSNLGEVGVSFTRQTDASEVWFLPAELTRVTA